MALLDWMAPDVGLRVEGEGVVLRPPRVGDYARLVGAAPPLAAPSCSPGSRPGRRTTCRRAAFRRRLAAYQRDMDLGYGYAFLVFRRDDGELVGGITLSNIRRGVAQMGQIGYWVGEPLRAAGLHAGRRARAVPGSRSAGWACIGWKRPAFPRTKPRARCCSKPGSSSRAGRRLI